MEIKIIESHRAHKQQRQNIKTQHTQFNTTQYIKYTQRTILLIFNVNINNLIILKSQHIMVILDCL